MSVSLIGRIPASSSIPLPLPPNTRGRPQPPGRLSNTHPPTGTHSPVRQANCRHTVLKHITCYPLGICRTKTVVLIPKSSLQHRAVKRQHLEESNSSRRSELVARRPLVNLLARRQACNKVRGGARLKPGGVHCYRAEARSTTWEEPP